MTYPIDTIRAAFLALTKPDPKGQLPLFFDAPGGSQLPKAVVEAMADYLYHYNSNMGGHAHAGQVTARINANARTMAGYWLGAKPCNIFFGLNSTSLMFQVARVLARTWQAGDNIVVSAIDHYSHVSSYETAAKERGVSVRFIPLADDGSLDLSALETLIDERTCLVAVSLASNVLGTKTDIAPIIARAKEMGAKVSIDAVHAIVHDKVDVAALGCDIAFASAYKMGGAHLGLCYLADELLAKKPYKVAPATDITPMAWEQGTQSFEGQASLVALINYWATLSGSTDDMPTALANSYRLVGDYERELAERFLGQAKARDYIALYGKDNSEGRTPTFAFNLYKDETLLAPSAVSLWFGERNAALPAGHFYAQKVADKFAPSFLRAGFVHYSHQKEVDGLFDLLDEYVASYKG